MLGLPTNKGSSNYLCAELRRSADQLGFGQ